MSYLVSVVMPFGGIVKEAYEKDPEKAILRWCRYSSKYPTRVSIQPEAQEGGQILLRWASDNIEKVREYLTENKSPYRIDWMIEEIHPAAGKRWKNIHAVGWRPASSVQRWIKHSQNI